MRSPGEWRETSIPTDGDGDEEQDRDLLAPRKKPQLSRLVNRGREAASTSGFEGGDKMFYIGLLLGAILCLLVLLWRQRPEPQGQYGALELTLHEMLEELEAKYRELEGRLNGKAAELESVLEQARLLVQQASSLDADKPRIMASEKALAVHRLAAQGLEPVAIAQELGLGTGEVTLILGLQEFMDEEQTTS